MSDGWVTVCKTGDVGREDLIQVEVGDTTLIVVHTKDGRMCALASECTHGRANLADGFVHGSTIECPKHNGRFDAITGAPRATPARIALEVFETQVMGGDVQVRLQGQSSHGRREA